MTLAELFDAITGFNAYDQSRRDWMLFGVRKQIAFLCWVNGNKDLREEDIFQLDLDEEIKRHRYANMKPIEVKKDGD